jgi:hypothetical protein
MSGMSTQKSIRAYRQLLKANGFKVDEIIYSKHIKIRASYKGRPATFTIPVSSSSRYALQLAQGLIARTRRDLE